MKRIPSSATGFNKAVLSSYVNVTTKYNAKSTEIVTGRKRTVLIFHVAPSLHYHTITSLSHGYYKNEEEQIFGLSVIRKMSFKYTF